ncbi:MAG: NUDIX domain-containing protein [Candidatus Roizmanbacteria bacterium]
MKSRIIVAAVIENEGHFLLGQKPRDVGPYPNTWHLLGGGVNVEQESLEDALRREIQEEAGLKIDTIRRVSFDEDYEPDKKGELTHYVFLIFWAMCGSKKINASDDIERLQWFSKAELKNCQ